MIHFFFRKQHIKFQDPEIQCTCCFVPTQNLLHAYSILAAINTRPHTNNLPLSASDVHAVARRTTCVEFIQTLE